MKSYILDINLVLMYLRQNINWSSLEHRFDLKNTINAISVVTMGELWSLALRNQWGERRLKDLVLVTSKFIQIDINQEDIIQRYGQIDAYSQGKLKDKSLPISARNMGKNDLWIAATASVYNLELITTDQDYSHLNNIFLNVHSIDIDNLNNP